MEAMPGRKTTNDYLALFSVCTPLLMLLSLGLLRQPMSVAASIAFAALPVAGAASGIVALIRVRRSSSKSGRTPAVLGAAINLVIIAVFVSNAIAWQQHG